MTAEEILNIYYEPISEDDAVSLLGYDSIEDLYDSTIPVGYEDCQFLGWFSAKEEYDEPLASVGYDYVMHCVSDYSGDFIGMTIGNRLHDITGEINSIIEENFDAYNPDVMFAHGEELYNAYGPDVDVNDLDEYDAECYLLYISES